MTTKLETWLQKIENMHPTTVDLGLDRIKIVASRLNLLKSTAKIITITGTNGKGSTVAFLETVLHQAGYKVGAYYSPHLLRFNERVHLLSQEVNDAELIKAFKIIESAMQDVSLTFFEFTTLAALYIFRQQQLDFIILEVGLGGRLDAVNIVNADIAVITSIGLDHCDWLGSDRESIAIEKAAIGRSGKALICGDENPPANLEKIVNANNGIFFQLGKNFQLHKKQDCWSWSHEQYFLDNLPHPAIILTNAATALMVLHLLSNEFFIPLEIIKNTLQTLRLPARQQILEHNSIKHIFDVAHNQEAVIQLRNYLKANINGGKINAVFSMLQDKPIQESVAVLRDLISEWHIAKLAQPRAASLQELREALLANNITNFKEYPTIEKAYESALKQTIPQQYLLIFGSFYCVSAILSKLASSV